MCAPWVQPVAACKARAARTHKSSVGSAVVLAKSLREMVGLAVRSKLSTWDDYAIMAMVEDGLGVSILPALILRRCQFDVAVRPLEGHPHRQINAIYRTADVSLAAARFLEYL